ncbi:hypothetical protein MW887_011974 [Aspergillus wentii]|nr:hypothetical protein MW887_011974 [Aspergillus wentii]
MPMITNFVYIIGMRQLPEEWIVDQAIYIKQKKLLPHSPQPSPKLFRGEKRRIHHQKACDAAAKRHNSNTITSWWSLYEKLVHGSYSRNLSIPGPDDIYEDIAAERLEDPQLVIHNPNPATSNDTVFAEMLSKPTNQLIEWAVTHDAT